VRVVLVHYHEIGLKGHNRADFERRLQTNLRWATEPITGARATRLSRRITVPIPDESRADEVLAAVARTPGVAYAGYAIECARESEAMEAAAVEVTLEEMARLAEGAPALGRPRTFRIDARRSATDYAERSLAMNERLGDAVRQATGLGVDLGAPAITCAVEVVQARAYAYARRVAGPGGLPVGVSGTVVALMSAGIDSPVAAWQVMRRGATVVGIHFSGRPQTPGRSERLAADLAGVLSRSGGMRRLYVVPFGDVQREIALATPESLRVLLYRRFMMRVAERVAAAERAGALVTGESLGQVASQTLENIAAVDAVATLPVLRPLIGSDKLEIMERASEIGTYDLSIASDDDCCSLFMPRAPETHASLGAVEAAEEALNIDGLVERALAGMTSADFDGPWRKRNSPGVRP
jgi:thiamine biosynthesis protein ThiI